MAMESFSSLSKHAKNMAEAANNYAEREVWTASRVIATAVKSISTQDGYEREVKFKMEVQITLEKRKEKWEEEHRKHEEEEEKLACCSINCAIQWPNLYHGIIQGGGREWGEAMPIWLVLPSCCLTAADIGWNGFGIGASKSPDHVFLHAGDRLQTNNVNQIMEQRTACINRDSNWSLDQKKGQLICQCSPQNGEV